MPDAIPDPADEGSALAIIAASHEPEPLLTGEQVVLAASRTFCRAFDLDPANVVGQRLIDLGIAEWAFPGFQALLAAAAFGSVPVAECEIDLVRQRIATRRLVVHVGILDGGAADQVRLLLSFTDVTDARAETRQKEELIRQQAVLIREVQHRIANSLQIIAGLLMQSARQVQSEEARMCLRDARLRVIAVASVQKQFSEIGDDSVSLRSCRTQLCDGLASAMISDPSRLSIRLSVHDNVVSGAEAASLGLIVTELVINALKYAFPAERPGEIVVDYRSDANDWVLSVSDNGVGVETGLPATKTGLGTGIVDALSSNLHAEMVLADCQPGTKVTITHHAGQGRKAVLSVGSQGPDSLIVTPSGSS